MNMQTGPAKRWARFSYADFALWGFHFTQYGLLFRLEFIVTGRSPGLSRRRQNKRLAFTHVHYSGGKVKKFFAFVLAVFMLMSLLPAGALAGYSTSYYTVTIKAYVYDPSTYGSVYSWGLASFDSKGFNGTTKGDNYNETPWQWAASGSNYNNYTVTAKVNTATNAFMNLKAPQYLWDYDSSKYEFLGWVYNGQ